MSGTCCRFCGVFDVLLRACSGGCRMRVCVHSCMEHAFADDSCANCLHKRNLAEVESLKKEVNDLEEQLNHTHEAYALLKAQAESKTTTNKKRRAEKA